MKRSLFVFLMLLGSLCIYAQHSSITGKVTDRQNEPIIGASVVVKGSSQGVISDIDGNFTLKNVPSEGTLQISYIGYKTSEVDINPSTSFYAITLEEDNQLLDEVVVVGFGTQRRANLTEAVATVDTKALESRPVTSLGQSLQGTVPGLNLSVGNMGGQLGQSMDVNIRGTGTISTGSTAATLVLIDGIEGNMNN